jgi:hypothetical protein
MARSAFTFIAISGSLTAVAFAARTPSEASISVREQGLTAIATILLSTLSLVAATVAFALNRRRPNSPASTPRQRASIGRVYGGGVASVVLAVSAAAIAVTSIASPITPVDYQQERDLLGTWIADHAGCDMTVTEDARPADHITGVLHATCHGHKPQVTGIRYLDPSTVAEALRLYQDERG